MAHCISVTICKYQKDLEELHDKGYYFSVENGYAIIAINYEL